MKMFKRVSAFIMAFVMVFGLLPALGATHAHATEVLVTNPDGTHATLTRTCKFYNAVYGLSPLEAYKESVKQNLNLAFTWDNENIYIVYAKPNLSYYWVQVRGLGCATGQFTPERIETEVGELHVLTIPFSETTLEVNNLGEVYKEVAIILKDYYGGNVVHQYHASEFVAWNYVKFVAEDTLKESNTVYHLTGDRQINEYYVGLSQEKYTEAVLEWDVTLNKMPTDSFSPIVTDKPQSRLDEVLENGEKRGTRYVDGISFWFGDKSANMGMRGNFGFAINKTADGKLHLLLPENNYTNNYVFGSNVIPGVAATLDNGSLDLHIRYEILYQTDADTLWSNANPTGVRGNTVSRIYINGQFVAQISDAAITNSGSAWFVNTMRVEAYNSTEEEMDITLNGWTIKQRYSTAQSVEALRVEDILGENASADAISGKLNLPTAGPLNGQTLEWTTSANIDAEGNVSCSADGTATATVKVAGTDYTKTFTFTVADSAHAWDDGVVDPDATCNTPGTKTYTCTSCGATKTEDVPVNDNHNYEVIDRTDATCVADGVVKYQCSICGDTYDEVLTATGAHTGGEADCQNQPICDVCGQPYGETGGHKWVAQEGKDATCTEKGYTDYEKCSVCSAEQGKEDIGVADHTFLKGIASDKVKTEANCNDAAVYFAKCDNCEFVSDDVTVAVGEALGHNHGAAATCITAQTCTRCFAVITPATGIHNHTVPAGHKDATCIEAGYDKFKCETCDDIKTDVIPATAIHNYTVPAGHKDATCIEAGYDKYKCETCDDIKTDVIPATAIHNHTVPVDHKDATCIEAGYDKYKCETCDDIKTVVIDVVADAHDMQPVAPQAPDFGVVGWEAYEKCSRCDHTEGYVEIPALIGVAKIGDKYYVSLEAAIADAADGAYIELLDSVSGPGLKIEKNITIDFGRNTYTFTDPATGSVGTTTLGMQILEGYEVTLKNGTLNVAEAYKTSYAVLIQNYADLTISGMTLDGTYLDRYTIKDYNYSYVVSVNCGTVLIENTTIKANDGGEDIALTLDKYSNDTRDYPAPTVTLNEVTVVDGLVRINGATVVINSGNYTGNGSDGLIAIDSGKLTINGGTFDAALGADGYSMAIWAKGGETVINDGLFKNKADFEGDPDHGSDLIYAKYDAYVEITGGTFEAADERWALNLHGQSPDAIIIVKGGSFKGFNPYNNNTENPKFNYLAAGCKAELVGEYYVVTDGTPDGYHWCEDGTLNELVYHEGQTATCTQIGWDAYEECTCGCYSTYVEQPKLAHVYELDGEIWKCVCGKLPTGVLNGNGVAINVVNGVPTAGTCYTNGIEGVIAAGGYMFGEDGLLFTGFAGEGAARRYYNNGTSARYTLVTDGVNVYYATADGSFAKGYTYVSGTFDAVNYPANRSYMFDAETGVLIASGFVDGKYYDENGALVRWQMVCVDGLYYYLNGKGEVATGYTNVDHSITADMPVGYYMLDENGQRLTGFADNGAFYRDGRKVMWQMVEFEGNYYYLLGTGKAAKGTRWVDHTVNAELIPTGKNYNFDLETGALILN